GRKGSVGPTHLEMHSPIAARSAAKDDPRRGGGDTTRPHDGRRAGGGQHSAGPNGSVNPLSGPGGSTNTGPDRMRKQSNNSDPRSVNPRGNSSGPNPSSG